MITEWFLGLVEGFISWFMHLFDGLEFPAWAVSPPGAITTFFGYLDSMGAWVPWTVVNSVTVGVIGVFVVTFILKLVKQLLAHIPAFGGAG